MGLFKSDLYRFLTLGFATGALLVFGTMDGGIGEQVSGSMIPSAEAQAAP